jgi:YrbI family 3-deoxy-D-manno-octulosonate 8-phosphate phosphatase
VSTIAFVPVRCGSKSIPFKNIKSFCGKPLVYWNLTALQHCEGIDKIIVATDCEAIADVVATFEFSKVEIYWRSIQNAADTSSTESVMLEYIEATPNLQPQDLFLLVQATSPLTQRQDFEAALQQYRAENLDSLLSVVRIKRFFWNEDGTPKNYDFYNRPRRQDFDGDLMENGAFYIHTIGGILKHRCRLGDKVGVYEMPEYTAVELDEPHDWLVAEAVMQKNFLTAPSDRGKISSPLPFRNSDKGSIITNIKHQTSPTTHHTSNIKLFLSDVDGVLTDGSMYYTENGDEIKRFHTYDGMAFEMLRKEGIKTGIITSENTEIVARRAAKLKVDYLFQGKRDGGKLAVAQQICVQEGISLDEVAYIGDDLNCLDILQNVGLAACPSNAVAEVKKIPNIIQLPVKGGDGAVRAFVEMILQNQ